MIQYGNPVLSRLALQRAQPWFFALRPRHWSKNLIVFLPAFLDQLPARELMNADMLAGFVLMCACASAGYLFNDSLDAGEDRRNMRKRFKPVAAGLIRRKSAVLAAFLLAGVALCLAFMFLPAGASAMMAVYVAVAFAYSAWLKRLLGWDIVILTGFYLLRLMLGGALAGVEISLWLLAFAVCFFSSVALAKRLDELGGMQPGTASGQSRRAYRAGHAAAVSASGIILAGLAVALLVAYVAASETAQLAYQTPMLLWPAVTATALWQWRVWRMARLSRLGGDPVSFALTDPQAIALAAVTAAFLFAARW